MNNLEFGAFIAQLRKEQNMTQKDLADILHVTDKAVSKWETGKGFPDLKLMEPLAQALGVTMVELIQCQRQQTDMLTMEQAQSVVTQAMDRSERTTARRYLKLFRFTLICLAAFCALNLIPYSILLYMAITGSYWNNSIGVSPGKDVGIIGGADGPTAILVSHTAGSPWLSIGLPVVLLILCIVLAIRVWVVEKKLK